MKESDIQLIVCGGGSGGHTMPALTIIQYLLDNSLLQKDQVLYLGSAKGIESKLAPEQGIAFKAIKTGKLRRYFSIKNFVDPFNFFIGILQSFYILLSTKSTTPIFSTGGFVSLPVTLAAFLQRKKVYIHEQTAQKGLANALATPFAHRIFVSFEQSLKHYPSHKTVLTGYPVRKAVFENQKKLFTNPFIFISGGGNGSLLLNDWVRKNFEALTQKYKVVHQVGKSHLPSFSSLKSKTYIPFHFDNELYLQGIQHAELCISRSGAGTVSELAALGKASVFVPLKIAQKNEQYWNAIDNRDKLGSLVLEEQAFKDMSAEELLERWKERAPKKAKTKSENQRSASGVIVQAMGFTKDSALD